MTEGRLPGINFLGSDWLYEAENEEADERLKEQEAEQETIDMSILACFTTPQGRIVFDWLYKQTIEQPSFNAALGVELGTAMGFAREGQNALVMEIKRRMKRAQEKGTT